LLVAAIRKTSMHVSHVGEHTRPWMNRCEMG
jgi:hypothetical protein